MQLITRGMGCAGTYPDELDVRSGVQYGPGGAEFIGEMIRLFFGESFAHSIAEDVLAHTITEDVLTHTITD
jgi:hypothetical protein